MDVSKRRTTRDATLFVALAAAMWGLDGLLRKPLATELDAGTVVLWEHVIAVAVLLPWVVPALRAFARCTLRDQVAVVIIGVGSSAVATALFTRSFALASETGDFVTPLVLQKLQPIFAIVFAVALLHERLRASYAVYALPALAGAWLLTFADPFDVQVAELRSALYAIGAAVLWAAGTVLGRMVSFSLAPRDITTLRFVFGLIGSFVVAELTGSALAPGWHNMVGLVLLALIPGLIALWIYYRALARTAASRATLAELAFPLTAALVGVLFITNADGKHTVLSGTQWLGFAIVVLAVTALGLHEQRPRPAVKVRPADEVAAAIRP